MSQQRTAPKPILVNLREVAAMIPMPVSTLQKRCAAGPESGLIPTPVYKIGRKLMWKPADVVSWVEAQAVAA